MTHTQAPWEVKSFINCTAVVSGTQVVATVGPTADDTLPDDQEECSALFAQANANARLIAAAPELLAALRMAMEATDDDRSWEDAAIAAIAKAGGAA